MATEILRPNAAGDETNIAAQSPTSGSHWDKVDEETADDDSTYVKEDSTSYQRDLYNLGAPSGSGTINYIKVWYRFRVFTFGGSETAYLKPAIKIGGNAYEGDEDTETASSYKNGSYQWTDNPSTGNPWTFAELADLQAGIALKIAGTGTYPNARCTQVYVEVDYTAGVTEKTSSDAGSGADAVESLQTPQAKTSSDTGSGVEGTPLSSAILAGSETGSGIEALIFRLLATVDTGDGVEAGSVETDGQLKNLFAAELGEGSDCLVAKIEIPAKGGGMKLWT